MACINPLYSNGKQVLMSLELVWKFLIVCSRCVERKRASLVGTDWNMFPLFTTLEKVLRSSIGTLMGFSELFIPQFSGFFLVD